MSLKMRLRPFVPVLELRHWLFWAKARSRSGKVALGLGLALVGWTALLIGLGGSSVGAAAARLGKGGLLADFVFGGTFIFATFAALFFGLDNHPAFSDESLRRYPLSRFERLVSRYAVGLFDPLWLFVFVLDLGVATGYAALGASHWWIAIPAAILLFLTNYLAARLLVEIVGRIMVMRGGPVLLVLAAISLFTLPGMIAPALRAPNRLYAPEWLAVLRFTPPAAAATVVAGAPALATASWMLLIIGWFLGLGAALVALEGKPRRSTAVAGAEASWNSFYDRITPLFGPKLSPLAGKTLRYYFRSPMFWLNYPLAAIYPTLFAFIIFRHESDPLAGFLVALAVISFVGFGGGAAVSANAFGYDRSGFRRYFFLPVSAADVIGAVELVPLALGGVLISVSIGIWLVFWRRPVDARMLIMLLSSGFGGMFLYQALGLWTSLLTPRTLELKLRFGNRLSLAQNVVVQSGVVVCIFLPLGFMWLGSRAVLAHWWVAPVFLLAAVGLFAYTLHEGARVFSARRERMLSTIERSK
jgi:hypothetical protein